MLAYLGEGTSLNAREHALYSDIQHSISRWKGFCIKSWAPVSTKLDQPPSILCGALLSDPDVLKS